MLLVDRRTWVRTMSVKNLYEKQIAIINVGMSTADGIPGPLFEDGTFTFIPIPESKPSERTPIYSSLGLSKWVSNPELYVHHDPEFRTMTFGDYMFKKNGKRNNRVANVLKLQQKDFLFFFASLSNEKDRRKRKTTGLFLIGYFEIRQILPYKEARSSTIVKQNAHRLREKDKGYIIWKGTKRSSLLEYAVPMSKGNVDSYLRTSRGDYLPWDSEDKNGRTRTDLEVINSSTRASRLIQPEFREMFWKIVIEKNQKLSIFQ